MHDFQSIITQVIALGEQGAIGAQIAFVQYTGRASIRCGARVRAQFQYRPQARVKVMIAKRPLKCSESRFAGTVTGSDVVRFVGVMQGCGNFFDCRVLGHHQMKPARDEVDVRIDLGGFGNDALNAGCEQATTNTMPSAVLMANDNSFNSFVPDASDTRAINVMPGTSSVVLSIN